MQRTMQRNSVHAITLYAATSHKGDQTLPHNIGATAGSSAMIAHNDQAVMYQLATRFLCLTRWKIGREMFRWKVCALLEASGKLQVE